jgi:hypothetical protein
VTRNIPQVNICAGEFWEKCMDQFQQCLITAKRIDEALAERFVLPSPLNPLAASNFRQECNHVATRNSQFFELLGAEILSSLEDNPEILKELFPGVKKIANIDREEFAKALKKQKVEGIIQDIVNLANKYNNQNTITELTCVIKLLTVVSNVQNYFFAPSAQRLEIGRYYDIALRGGSPGEFVTVADNGDGGLLVRTADGLRVEAEVSLPAGVRPSQIEEVFRIAGSRYNSTHFIFKASRTASPDDSNQVSGYTKHDKISMLCVGETAYPVDRDSLEQIGDLVFFSQKGVPMVANGTSAHCWGDLQASDHLVCEFDGRAYLIREYTDKEGSPASLYFHRVQSDFTRWDVSTEVEGTLDTISMERGLIDYSKTGLIKILGQGKSHYVCLKSGRIRSEDEVIEKLHGYLVVKQEAPQDGWDCYNIATGLSVGQLPSGVDPRKDSIRLVDSPFLKGCFCMDDETGEFWDLGTGEVVLEIRESAERSDFRGLYCASSTQQYYQVTWAQNQGYTFKTSEGKTLESGMETKVGNHKGMTWYRYIKEREDGATQIWNPEAAQCTAPFGVGFQRGLINLLQPSDCTKYAIFEVKYTSDPAEYCVVDVSGQEARVCYTSEEKPAFFGGSLRLPFRSCVMHIQLAELDALRRDESATSADAGAS